MEATDARSGADPRDDTNPSLLPWRLLYAALTLSVGNGGYIAYTGQTAYTKELAAADFRLFEHQIQSIAIQHAALASDIKAIDATTPHNLASELADFEQRLRAIERHIASHPAHADEGRN